MIQNRRLITVFSATRYCGTDDNNGGILQLIDRDRYWRLSAKYLKISRAGPTEVNSVELYALHGATGLFTSLFFSALMCLML
jgi:hypothetical protein